MTERPWLSVEEIASQLGVTRGAIQGWMNDGTLPYLKINRTIRIHKNDFENLIKNNTYNAIQGGE